MNELDTALVLMPLATATRDLLQDNLTNRFQELLATGLLEETVTALVDVSWTIGQMQYVIENQK